MSAAIRHIHIAFRTFEENKAVTQAVGKTDEAIINGILADLDALSGVQATPNFIDGFVQNWENENFMSEGCLFTPSLMMIK